MSRLRIHLENPLTPKRTLPSDKTIAVYCGTGKRSGMAADELSREGYRILNLEGGLTAWKEAGLPVTTK